MAAIAAVMPGQQVVAERIPASEPEPDRDDDEPDRDDEHQAHEPIELLLQWGASALLGRQAAGDAADLRAGAGGDDDPLAPSADHAHARVRHRPAIRHPARHGIRFDAHRLRDGLARQDAAIQDEAIRPDQAQVGRNDVPDMEENDVAGDEVGRREIHGAAVTPDLGPRRGGVPERLEGALPSVLGGDVRADERNESGQDEQAVADLPDEGGRDARHQQDEHERLRRGAQHQSPDLRWIRRGQRIRAGLRGSVLRITARQPDPWVHPGPHGDRADGERVCHLEGQSGGRVTRRHLPDARRPPRPTPRAGSGRSLASSRGCRPRAGSRRTARASSW